MATIHDVAAYILKKLGPMSAMKLQKLVYYAQAWSLVWEDRPIFRARIEAWANGPVAPILYKKHRGSFRIQKWPEGDASRLSEEDSTTVNSVVKFYGDKSPQWLSDLTHMEDPWIIARRGLAPGATSNNEITIESMQDYYASLRSNAS